MSVDSQILVQLQICTHNYILSSFPCPQDEATMQPGICQEIKPFNFYSLEEFEYKQLISRGRYFVGLFEQKETKVDFIVKEIPYHERRIEILRKIEKMKGSNFAPLLGLCLYRARIGWLEHSRVKAEQIGEKQERKQSKTLLLFMQRYEMNLHEYVALRRKNIQLFTVQEIKAFVHQMLNIFERLQREGVAHRDIKPQNILVHQNAYLLCDFEDAVEVKAEEKVVVDLTTVEYSSPEFLRYIRHPKEKCFDPFKLDVYSFGLTLLFLCSMGRFSLEERTNFIYESSEKSHADFIKDQRVKWIRNQGEYKTFNSLIKLMLEEDEYKRDDFITLLIKTQFKEEDENSEYNLSDDNSNSKSSANLKKKQKKAAKERKLAEIKYRELKVYGGLSAGMIVIFILFCLL